MVLGLQVAASGVNFGAKSHDVSAGFTAGSLHAGDGSCLTSFRYAVWAKFRSREEFARRLAAGADGQNVHPGSTLVAFTHRPLYFIASIAVPEGASLVSFWVQPRLLSGEWLPSEQCPAVDVELPDR